MGSVGEGNMKYELYECDECATKKTSEEHDDCECKCHWTDEDIYNNKCDEAYAAWRGK